MYNRPRFAQKYSKGLASYSRGTVGNPDYMKVFCITHNKQVGKDQFGNPYKQCYFGYRDKEECEVKDWRV